jgi:hypothetical protein
MLKRGDPVFDELAVNLQSVASSRYVEDPYYLWGVHFMRSETGLRFEQLNPADRLTVLEDTLPWDDYRDQGLSSAQAGVIFSNVRDGKPQEKWFDGVFEEAVLERHKVEGFKKLVEHSKNSPSNHCFEEMDGNLLPWVELSNSAKLQYIASYAAYCDVPLKPFADMVKDAIGYIGDVALPVVLDAQKELHAIAKLFPDDGRTEPTPLVEQVKEILDYASALEAQEKERRQGKEKLFEGISNLLDGKAPQGWLEGAKAFQDILRGDHPKQQEVETKERSREM